MSVVRLVFQRRRKSTVMNNSPINDRYKRRSTNGSLIGTNDDVGASMISTVNQPKEASGKRRR